MVTTADALLERATLKIRALKAELAQARVGNDIALVGIGCRCPGGASDPAAFWDLLEKGQSHILEAPPTPRWHAARYCHQDAENPGTMYSQAGGYISGSDECDPEFFGISPREAAEIDPHHRILLEVCHDALEDACQNIGALQGSRTGLYVGMGSDDYARFSAGAGETRDISAHSALGTARSIGVGRIAYTFGFNGPVVQLDTSCSSSLLAIHLACRALRGGEADLALAGGVNLILTPEMSVGFSKLKALSPTGKCRSFDAEADGYVRGEGCGVVVLKRLDDARRDGDRIIAVVRGSAVNHDGRSNGLTAPNAIAQRDVMRAALKDAGLPPSAVSYIEAHGTGTPLGDPIELASIAHVYGGAREQPLPVGSVKAMIGHLESAAGIAAFIKTALMVQKGIIVPQPNFSTPNPQVPWDRIGLTIPKRAGAWAAAAPRRAGVSAFGMSGTNVHLLLEGLPPSTSPEMSTEQAQLLVLTARTPDALGALVKRYQDRLSQADNPTFAAICATTNVRRRRHHVRLAVVALNGRLAAGALEGAVRHDVLAEGDGRAAGPTLIFAGHCAPYRAIGRAMAARFPAFHATLHQIIAAFEAQGVEGLGKVMWSEDPTDMRLQEAPYARCAIFAVQVAYARLWRALGLQSYVVQGDDIGGIAAAHVAGVFGLEDAARLVVAKARLMQAPTDGSEAIVDGLRMAEKRAMLTEVAETIAYKSPECPVFSDLSGDITDAVTSAGFWIAGRDAKRCPANNSANSPSGGNSHFFDDGAEPVLQSASTRQEENFLHMLAPMGGCDDEVRTFLKSVGHVVSSGMELDLRPLSTHMGQPVSLPLYPFNKRRFWKDNAFTAAYFSNGVKHADRPEHVLLGQRLATPHSDEIYYENRFTLSAPYFMDDHRLFGVPIVAGACHIAMLAEAARDLLGTDSFSLKEVLFIAPLLLDETQGTTVQLLARPSQSRFELAIYSLSRGANGRDRHDWVRHATAIAEAETHGVDQVPEASLDREGWDETGASDEFYQRFNHKGYTLGASFRWLGRGWHRGREVIHELPTGGREAELADYFILPGYLDSCFHCFESARYVQGVDRDDTDDGLIVPSGIAHIDFYGAPSERRDLICRAVLKEADRDRLKGLLELSDGDGVTVMRIEGFEGRRVPRALLESKIGTPVAACEVSTLHWSSMPPTQGALQAFSALAILVDDSLLARDLVALCAHTGVTHRVFPHDALSSLARDEAATQVLQKLSDDASRDWHLVNFWDQKWDAASDRPLIGLDLARALAGSTRFKKNVSGLSFVMRDDASGAAIMGFARSVTQEIDGLNCRVIVPENDLINADALLRTLCRDDVGPVTRVTQEGLEVPTLVPMVLPEHLGQKRADDRGRYLITGATGALAGEIVARLVARGARHFDLVARRAPDAARVAAFASLHPNVHLRWHQADVADPTAIATIIAECRSSSVLAGVFHCAGVLSDATLPELNDHAFDSVRRPKARGARLLSQFTADDPPEVFVVTSSIAGLLGPSGQANYALANGYLNGLVDEHARQGRGGLSVILGPLENEAGASDGMMATMDARLKARLHGMGAGALPMSKAAELIVDLALEGVDRQVVLGAFDWPRLAENFKAAGALASERPFGRDIMAASSQEAVRLMALPADERDVVAAQLLREDLAQLLSLPDAGAIRAHDRFLDLGIDSLLAIELKTRVQRWTGLQVSATAVFDYPTVGALAAYLVAQLSVSDSDEKQGSDSDAGDAFSRRMAEMELLLGDSR